MKHIHKIAFAAMFALCLLCGASARAAYLPPACEDCAGIRHLMLIYSGNFEVQSWNAEDLATYVYHLGANGKPDDWFFDGFLFLGQYLPGGQLTEGSPMAPPSDLKGWRWFLDRIFTKGKFLDALNATIGATPIGPAPSTRAAVIMIPYPAPRLRDFGDADGDGRSEDFSRAEDRARAVRAYVEDALARWDAADFKNLRLAGFYWMEESYHPEDAPLMKEVSALMREKNKKLFWIPYYFGNPGTPRWKQLGFDCATQQPNYFFPRWNAEKTRVNTTARTAKRLGMGMEMEFDESVLTSEEQYGRYLRYLNAGVEEGFMTGSFAAWYQGSRALLELSRSADPRLRGLYDYTWQFVKGNYSPEK